VVVEGLQDHFKVVLPLHQVGTHEEAASFENDLVVDFGVLSGCVDVVLRIGHLLAQIETDLLFLDELVMKQGLTSVVRFRNFILLLVLLLFEGFQLRLRFTTLPRRLRLRLDLVVDLLEDVLLLLFQFFELPVQLLDFSVHTLQVE